MRRAARTDSNHAEIVKAFRALGCTVLDLSQLGSGCPDILVGTGVHNVLVEIKDGAKKPSARKLTPDEKTFFDEWKGPRFVAENLSDVVRVVNVWR
jgi:Holliday junction resolvase